MAPLSPQEKDLTMAITARIIRFETRLTRDPATKKMEKQVDWVLMAASASKVNKAETWHRVKDLIPNEKFDDRDDGTNSEIMDFFRARWAYIKPHYENYKKGIGMTDSGTSINSWPMLSQDEIRVFHSVGIHTIEDIAELNEGDYGFGAPPRYAGEMQGCEVVP